MARPSSSDRARRLLVMLPYLAERGTAIPLETLARKLGCDAATVAGDVVALGLCGTDQCDPGSFVDVYVEDGAVVVPSTLPALGRPVRLTPAEARALATALETIGLDPASALPRRLAQVAGQDPDVEAIARTVRAAHTADGEAATIAALGMAAISGRVTAITYASASSGQTTARLVHPYALYNWRGAWYLLAYCETAGDQRTFRLDRISGVRITDRTFEPPVGARTPDAPLPDLGSLPRATVRFARLEPDLTEREWPGAVFEMQDDGSVVAEVPYAGTSWIARKVAARLGDAEVLRPAEVRDAVARTARRLLDEVEQNADEAPKRSDG